MNEVFESKDLLQLFLGFTWVITQRGLATHFVTSFPGLFQRDYVRVSNTDLPNSSSGIHVAHVPGAATAFADLDHQAFAFGVPHAFLRLASRAAQRL